MSDFILDYDILESIAKNSNLLGKRSEEYAEHLENKIINAIENVTGPSSGYLTGASDSVRDKINALKIKTEDFYHFAEKILNLLEVAEQIDQEVADAIAAGREYFLDHHESLRIDDWRAKLLGLYVELKNSIPLLGTIADIIKIATEPTYSNLYRVNNVTGEVELTGFGREFMYLKEECNYVYDSVTKTMIPPK